MFDIGFSELMVIAVVALIVIGPERLPKVARTMGHLFGRLQRYVNDVKADINREIELDELRKFRSTVEDAASSVEQTIHSETAKAESELGSLAELADPNAPASAPATGGLTNPGATAPAQELKELKGKVEEAARSMEESAGAVERAVRAEAAETASELDSLARPGSDTALATAPAKDASADPAPSQPGPARETGEEHPPDVTRQKTAA
jgi:sec-independent protein translocase protein TatB